MPKQEPYAGVFAGMDFPPYQYEHYPLMMSKDQGETKVVENEAEEAEALAEGFKAPKVGPPANVTVQEIEELEGELKAKDKALSETTADLADAENEIEKLKAELAEAKKPKGSPPPPPPPAPGA